MRLSEAKKAQDILDVLARRAWHEAHDGAECPSDQVPTSADMVAWRPDDVSVRTALEQLVNLLDSQPFDKADLTPPLLLSHAMLNGGYGRFCKTFELPDPGAVFSYLLERTHQSWINLLGLWPDLRHPLAAMVQAWQGRIKAADPFNPVKRASLPRLQGMGEGELRLPGFPPSLGAPRQLELFAPAITSCPSWLLWLYDAAGGEWMAPGGRAPWAMRLFIGALLHLRIVDRDGDWHTLRFSALPPGKGPPKLPSIEPWLHPGGWSNRRRDWHRLPAALDVIRERLSYVPVPGLGSVALLMPSVIPRTPADPIVEFSIRIPAVAAKGARVEWPTLCRYGQESATLYRAYLSAIAYLDRSASKGHGITAQIGAPVLNNDGRPRRRKGGEIVRSAGKLVPNPAARYVGALTSADMVSMIGLDPESKERRRDTRRAFKRLGADGVIDFQEEGRDSFRIFQPRNTEVERVT
jgi:hypothetical protein